MGVLEQSIRAAAVEIALNFREWISGDAELLHNPIIAQRHGLPMDSEYFYTHLRPLLPNAVWQPRVREIYNRVGREIISECEPFIRDPKLEGKITHDIDYCRRELLQPKSYNKMMRSSVPDSVWLWRASQLHKQKAHRNFFPLDPEQQGKQGYAEGMAKHSAEEKRRNAKTAKDSMQRMINFDGYNFDSKHEATAGFWLWKYTGWIPARGKTYQVIVPRGNNKKYFIDIKLDTPKGPVFVEYHAFPLKHSYFINLEGWESQDEQIRFFEHHDILPRPERLLSAEQKRKELAERYAAPRRGAIERSEYTRIPLFVAYSPQTLRQILLDTGFSNLPSESQFSEDWREFMNSRWPKKKYPKKKVLAEELEDLPF